MSASSITVVSPTASRLTETQIEIVNRALIHTEMVGRLLTSGEPLPLDFATFLEDVGNVYLEIADQVNNHMYIANNVSA